MEEALAPISENLFDILDAIGKGFSVHEIDWETSAGQWMPRGLSYLQPYWLQTRREDPETLYLRSDTNIYGDPLAPYKFITHKVKAKSGVLIRGGLARMACWAFLFSNYAIKDWVTFAEAYGQPLRVGKYDVSATPQDIETLLTALRSLGTDAAAAIPKNMEIDFVDVSNKTASVDIYARLTEYLDKQTSKIVLGQTLATNTGGSSGGGAYALGKVHNEVREDILDADVKQLEATLARDYVKPVVDLNLGPQQKYPAIRLRINKPEDLTALAGVVDKLVRV
ncbi:phage portal protein family protein [Paludibacterium denitrificans]|uniref:phage portal protein family protein n=1 Tax=Paludibacterium denitrificans TaxID=2675226 RepID=UPI00406BB6AA